MGRDYKRSARSARRSQRRGQKRRRRSSSGAKAVLWLVAGLTIGLGFGLGGWYLAEHRAAPAKKTAAAGAQPKKSADNNAEKANDDAVASKTKADRPWHFDFYRLLPKMEVVVSEEELAAGQDELAKEKPHGPYILQIASFRSYSDADALKARLALLGIQASIEAIVVDNGNTWNRVRVGPFPDMKSLKPVRRQLEHEQIAFMMIELNRGAK